MVSADLGLWCRHSGEGSIVKDACCKRVWGLSGWRECQFGRATLENAASGDKGRVWTLTAEARCEFPAMRWAAWSKSAGLFEARYS